MDDFDDLLDEVEKDIEKSSKKSQISKPTKPVSLNLFDEEIDSILNDHDEFVDVKQQKKEERQSKSTNHTKCKFLYLGGSKTPTGMCSVTCKRCCNRLRCTSCDFKVEQFDDFEWSRSVDYLFLRNNMPDFQKISQRLSKKTGCRAYACQCSWKSVDTLTSLNHSSLKWVCGKH